MSDRVGNLEDLFSRVAAHMFPNFMVRKINNVRKSKKLKK